VKTFKAWSDEHNSNFEGTNNTAAKKGSKEKFIVVDNPFNRANYRDLIGKVFDSDKIPSYAGVKKIEPAATQSKE